MLKKIILLFILLIIVSCQAVCGALDVSARSAILICADTGEVLYEKNADERLPMASTTKIMTALVAIEKGSLDRLVEVDPSAVGIEGSSMYLYMGEKITLENLLYGLMLSSGNDAAQAVAVHIGKSADGFAALMNERALQMGLENTSFENPSGLDGENHYTTARELSKIAREAMKNETFREIVGTSSHKAGAIQNGTVRWVHNHNKMLSLYDGANGIKTGFTKTAGRCLVSSAKRDKVTLIAVTLNCPDDWNDHQNMLDYGFASISEHTVLKSGASWNIPVGGGVSDFVTVTLDGDVTGKAYNAEGLSYRVYLPKHMLAPVREGVRAGEVAVFYEDNFVSSHELYITEGVPAREHKPSFFERIKEWIAAIRADEEHYS